MTFIHCYPYDFQYKYKDGIVYVILYAKTTTDELITIEHPYAPYFYVSLKNVSLQPVIDFIKNITLDTKPEPAKVLRWEETTKNLLGTPQPFLKVYVNYPRAVPLIAKELTNKSYTCHERDILFVHRYLRDLQLTPMTLTEIEGTFIKDPTSYRTPLFRATKVTPLTKDTAPFWNILAVDIETYAEKKEIDMKKNPILMLSFYGINKEGKEFRKVITWKKFHTTESYIEFVPDEKTMLEQFKHYLIDYNPDIITGYFTDGFDFPYIKTRSYIHNVKLDIGKDYSDLDPGKLTEKKDSETKIAGILHIDIFKFVKNIFGKDLKIESLSLDSVAAELIGHKKHVVDLDKLAHIWNNEPEKLEHYCAYNLHDSLLTHKLTTKLLPDIIEFTKTIDVPLFDLIRMRFSRLVESYILKRAIEFNEIAPNKPDDETLSERMEESIEGAFVYEPTPGIYKDIVVFDFRSLYPSIISAHNIGPESFQCACCKNLLHVPEQPNYWFCKKQRKFIPTVLDELLTLRTQQKKLLQEAKKRNEDVTLLQARVYSLKILANSFYGYLGFYGARWYSLECAASTTAYARNYIKQTIQQAERHGFKILYGDSLTPERKIFVMNPRDEIILTSIGSFVDNNLSNTSINQYKTLAFNGKKVVFSPIERVIRHNYNSEMKGEIIEYTTTHGKTRVTPQHSVYTFENKNINCTNARTIQLSDYLVSLTNVPNFTLYTEGHIFDLAQLSFGHLDSEIFGYTDNLQFPAKEGKCPYCNKTVQLAQHIHLHHPERRIKKEANMPTKYNWIGTQHAEGGKIPRYWTLTTELAWILGYYCAEGSASSWISPVKKNRKYVLSFGSQDQKVILRVKRFFDTILQEDLKMIVDFDKHIQKHTYYSRVQRIPLVGLFIDGFGCGQLSSGKKVPSFIYTSEEKIKRAFLAGYLEGEGNKKKDKRYVTHFIRFDTKSKELACGLQYLFKSLDHGTDYFGREIKHVGWRYRKDKPLISSLRIQSAQRALSFDNIAAAKIKKINKEHYTGPVYDLEIAGCHNFVDAEGLILVHNTDSLFVILGDKPFSQALEFMQHINKTLPGQMELECDGQYTRGIFVAIKGTEKGAKKKYALITKDGKMKITGFETVRRNWSQFAKEVQQQTLRLILTDKIDDAFQTIRQTAKDLIAGKILLDKLIIKTQITRDLSSYTSIGPHILIAQQLAAKGEKITPGTLIQYILVKGTGLVRDRAKLPSDVKPGDYDADYYLHHQLIPAVAPLFAVLGYSEDDLFHESSQQGLGQFL